MSKVRLARMHEVMASRAGDVFGLVTLVSRRGEVHVDAIGPGGGCALRLDEPVDLILPEPAERRVLKRLDGPIDDTVPARRPITVRDLITFRMGMGIVMASARRVSDPGGDEPAPG